MTTPAKLDDVLAALKKFYGDFADPDFSLLHHDSMPGFAARLRRDLPGVTVTADVDEDNDHGYSFHCEGAQGARFVQISKVGPFACVRVLEEPPRYLSVASARAPIDIALLRVLGGLGLHLVEPAVLAHALPEFALPNTDPPHRAVYHALFSDTGLPV